MRISRAARRYGMEDRRGLPLTQDERREIELDKAYQEQSAEEAKRANRPKPASMGGEPPKHRYEGIQSGTKIKTKGESTRRKGEGEQERERNRQEQERELRRKIRVRLRYSPDPDRSYVIVDKGDES